MEGYYLGLDIGTSSVGWAVTNENYDILKKNRKYLYGSRLFDEAKTQIERRNFRASRRRRNRIKERVRLLKEIFKEAIFKVDPLFFKRQENSFYHLEDKSEEIKTKNVLFDDVNFTDKDYFKKYPTIYHLRNELIESDEYHDPRLVYLAIKHIIEHRGHFLLENLKYEDLLNLDELIDNFFYTLQESNVLENNFKLTILDKNKFITMLKNKETTRLDKVKNISEELSKKLFEGNKNIKQIKAKFELIFKLILGLSCNCSKLFEIKEKEISISFEDLNYDIIHDELELIIGNKIELINTAKIIYDFLILDEILKNNNSNEISTFSKNKCLLYDEHAKDLDDIQYIFKKYFSNIRLEEYLSKFISLKLEKNNKLKFEYKGKKNKESTIEILEKDIEIIKKIEHKIVNSKFLESLRSSFNSVIPIQVHTFELEKILENASKYLPFLNYADESKISNIEKIKMIQNFRIPYYVGPINSSSDFSWVERKQKGKIFPWNFEKMIDIEKSSEKFIIKMLRKCTYLKNEFSLPKESILYQKFEVLNQINGLKINGDRINNEIKKKIFNDLFKVKNSVRIKEIKKYLVNEKNCREEDILDGVDEITVSLSSYNKIKNIINIDTDFGKEIAEDIIFWSTIHNDKKIIKKLIIQKYYNKLTEEQIEKLLNLKFKSWGRLSKKFLEEVEHAGDDTQGEFINIIDMMWNDNKVLMELLSNKYTFMDCLEKMKGDKKYEKFDYNLIMDELFLSPSIKRTVWQTLKLIEEIKNIKGDYPEKIFIEVTRKNEINGTKKDSRKEKIEKIYKSIDKKIIKEELNKELNGSKNLNSKKLYLYFSQLGKCIYSGENIKLLELFEKDKYDIDHIYPRSITKDDSFDNLVLVKKELNNKKSDDYPFHEKLGINENNKKFWKILLENKLISNEKYNRLISNNELTDKELPGFIARQLVETSQSIKSVIEILKVLCPNTEFVYVKSQIVSDFRKKYKYYKLRDINDFHHAHDAYLNVMLGNTYNIKFTKNIMKRIKELKENKKDRDKNDQNRKHGYNLEKMFDYDVYFKDKIIWNRNEMIPKIEKFLYKETPQVTRFIKTRNVGSISDQQLIKASEIKKGSIYLPIKNNYKLKQIEKYGAYSDIKLAYFFLVEHKDKKFNKLKTIEFVPIYKLKQIKTEEDLLNYCKNDLELKEPKILIDKIKINTEFKIDGMVYRITGRTGNRLIMNLNTQLKLDKDIINKLKIIYSYKKGNKEMLEKITRDDCEQIIKTIIDKFENSLYKYRKHTAGRGKNSKDVIEYIKNNLSNIMDWEIKDLVDLILEILDFFSNIKTAVNLEKIGFSKRSCTITFNKDITNLNEIKIINKSITGIFNSEINLKEL